jgi:hypothetical protein
LLSWRCDWREEVCGTAEFRRQKFGVGMTGAAFARLRVTAQKEGRNEGAVRSRRGKTTEQSQEVIVAQQLKFLASESKAKSQREKTLDTIGCFV